jgi:hypothetical protein
VVDEPTEVATMWFDGDRQLVRIQSVEYVFRQMLGRLLAVQ